MPSFTATVLFLPLLGLCSARCLPSAGTQGSTSLPVRISTSSPTVSKASSPAPGESQNTTSAAKIPDGFGPGAKWQINIQNPTDLSHGLYPADAKVIDVDLFHASKDDTLIPTLHEAGVIVICYFNLGAVQTTDCDWSSWDTNGLFRGKAVENYSQEKYVDITDSSVHDLHKSRIDLAHRIGCDAIDPDNIDTFELSADESVGKQITDDDMVSFLSTLASYAHSKTTTLGHSLMIGQKNAPGITERVHPFMDFAISENCVGSANVGSNRGATDEFCSVFEKYYVNNGKPVFDIEYPLSLASSSSSSSSSKMRRDDDSATDDNNDDNDKNNDKDAGCAPGASEADIKAYCASNLASSRGISRILKLDNDKYGLNGCTQYCDEATSFIMPTYPSNETNSCGT